MIYLRKKDGTPYIDSSRDISDVCEKAINGELRKGAKLKKHKKPQPISLDQNGNTVVIEVDYYKLNSDFTIGATANGGRGVVQNRTVEFWHVPMPGADNSRDDDFEDVTPDNGVDDFEEVKETSEKKLTPEEEKTLADLLAKAGK